MKLLNNKILTVFSLGLNLGFILFFIYQSVNFTDSRRERIWDISAKALEFAGVDESEGKKILDSEKKFFDELHKLRERAHGLRLQVLKIYSSKNRDEKQVKKLENEINSINLEKRRLFSSHIKNMDSILKDKSPLYFQYIYNEVSLEFGKK